MDAGYSGKPLSAKLGLKPGMRVLLLNQPQHYGTLVDLAEVTLLPAKASGVDCAHVFSTARGELEAQLKQVLPRLSRDGLIWVSWPKKSAAKQLGIATDLTEDVVRDIALPLGLVDVKVCAVDDVWSGLKLVIRKELR